MNLSFGGYFKYINIGYGKNPTNNTKKRNGLMCVFNYLTSESCIIIIIIILRRYKR